MSGIVGLLRFDGRPVERAVLAKLAAASRHRAIDGVEFWTDGPVGLGHRYFRVTPEAIAEQQPWTSSSCGISLDGRLDNRDELIAECHLGKTCSDAEIALTLYLRIGEEFIPRLAGDFALALADVRRGQVLLACDAMGGRSLYYACAGDTLIFASEMKAVLAYPGMTLRLDADSLADSLLNGEQDVVHTWFEGILTVSPGFMVVASKSGLQRRRYFDFHPRECRATDFDEYRERFGVLVEQAITRRLRCAGPVAVSVSGGLDSSTIFCTALTHARRAGIPTEVRGIAMTFEPESAADEQRYLDAIEALYDTRIERLPFKSVGLVLSASDSGDWIETPRPVWQAQLAVLQSACRAGCRVLMDGFFGDQALAPLGYLADLAHQGRWLELRHHLREMPTWMTDVPSGFLRSQIWAGLTHPLARYLPAREAMRRARAGRRYPAWYTAPFVERALDRAMTRRLPDDHAFNRGVSVHARESYLAATSGAYLTLCHHRRNAALQRGLDVAFPFRDRDLVEFLMQVPGAVVNRGGIPKGLLRDAMAGVLPDAIRSRRWKADFTALSNQAVAEELPSIIELFEGRPVSVELGFVDPVRLRAEASRLAGHLQHGDDATIGWQLSDVAAVEIWLRRVLNSDNLRKALVH